MLHPINLPDCLEALWTVVFIQEKLLNLAYANPFSPALLNEHFDEATVNWLWSHKQKLLDPLEEFSTREDQAEKKAIIDAFRHDFDYHNNLEDTSFTFQLQPKSSLPSPLAVSVGKWLENFYDITARKGVPMAVTGYHLVINQQLLLDEFALVNQGMCVCPTCDGTWMEPTSTRIVGSIDHFLPRSRYPALSLHPFNLIPICGTCNEKLKEDKDPFFDNQQRTLADIFVFCPGCCPPRPARDSVECHIDLNMFSPWVLQCGQATEAQLSLFSDIFDLPGRWQKRGDEIDRIVKRRLRDIMDLPRITSADVSRNKLHVILNRLEQRMRREWGEGYYLYPATYWLRCLHKHKFDDLAREFL